MLSKRKRIITSLILAFIMLYLCIMMDLQGTVHPGRPPGTTSLTNKVVSAQSFSGVMQNFPWDDFEKAVRSKNQSKIDEFAETLIETLTPFLIREPDATVDSACSIPELNFSDVVNYLYPDCKKRDAPIKIGMLLQFGFDVDTLEIHLHESFDLVDMFFIVESTRAHFNALRKPLIWELIKYQKRFSKFLEKIVHIVVDDADLGNYKVELTTKSPQSMTDKWIVEYAQESFRWKKFLTWNNVNAYFKDNDLIGIKHVSLNWTRQPHFLILLRFTIF
jgi:hypothetical protein